MAMMGDGGDEGDYGGDGDGEIVVMAVIMCDDEDDNEVIRATI